MNFKSITIILLFLVGYTAAFCQSEHFTIQGKINKANNGKFIKLYYDNDTLKVIDSVKVQNGSFRFAGALLAPTIGKLSFGTDETGDRIDLFLSQGNIRVTAKDSLSFAKISGTKLAESYEKLATKMRPVERKFMDQLAVVRTMPDGEAKIAYVTEIMKGFDGYMKFRRDEIHQFVIDNPDSYVALYQLDKTAMGRIANYETTFPYYEKLSPALKSTALGKALGERLLAAKGDLTGKQYTDFVSTTPEGTQLSLKEILAQNKYTLVDFWASWCGPCRKENPYVVKAYEAFNDKGFTVLSVSLDDNKERWEEAIKQDGMPWHHVSSLKGWKEPAAQLYGVRAIPQNVLIDAEGNIVASNLRGDTLYKKIEELLK